MAERASRERPWHLVTTFKKRSGKPYVSVEDLIDEALAHGWVDSRPRTLDDQRSQRPRSTKRAILEWINNAKTPATRTKRITDTVTKAAQNLRANQWRQPKGPTAQPPSTKPTRRDEHSG